MAGLWENAADAARKEHVAGPTAVDICCSYRRWSLGRSDRAVTSQFAPDFFLAGAPKCGTTALYSYLSEHPAVFMPWMKEPHFFCTDLPGLREVQTHDQYEALFRGAGQQLSGEASATYLYSHKAIPAVIALNPAARVIVLLRNPVDAAYALHQEFEYNLNESVTEFQHAWELQQSRLQGEHIPRLCREPAMLQYRSVYHYAEQLPRLFDCVPERQLLVLLFDELAADPQGVYKQVLSFLDLEDDGRDEFPRVNSAKVHRFPGLARAYRSATQLLGPLYAPLTRVADRVGIYPSRALTRWNVVPRQRSALSPVFRGELDERFEPDVQAVEDVVGRSLPEWRQAVGQERGSLR